MPTLSDFMSLTISQRMGGAGLTPTEEASVEAFLAAAPAPDNALHGVPLTPSQVHGEQLFVSATCVGCHAGPAYTNDGFANVGTLVTAGPVPDAPSALPNGLNVPSLLGVGRTAPYLHDGSAATLKERLQRNQAANLHGLTASLSDADLDNLVSFLQTL